MFLLLKMTRKPLHAGLKWSCLRAHGTVCKFIWVWGGEGDKKWEGCQGVHSMWEGCVGACLPSMWSSQNSGKFSKHQSGSAVCLQNGKTNIPEIGPDHVVFSYPRLWLIHTDEIESDTVKVSVDVNGPGLGFGDWTASVRLTQRPLTSITFSVSTSVSVNELLALTSIVT